MERISIITISYNSQGTIDSLIKSLKAQSFCDFEHVLIDGESTDKTINIVKKNSPSTKIVSEPDNGIYDAFNKGIKYSSGDIIGFLNSDDAFYDENSLKLISEAFDVNTDCIFGDLIYTDKHNNLKRSWKGSPFNSGAFKKGWMPAHPTFYCRRNVYDKFGRYNDNYKIAGDFELMLRFFEKHNVRSKYIPHTIVNMKVGGASNSGIKSKIQILNEEFRAFKENEIPVNKGLYILHKLKKLGEFKV